MPYTARVRSITLLLTSAIVLNAHAAPPDTEKRPYTYSLHGVEIEDPYHWLEGSDAPEAGAPDAALDAAVGEWTDAQNAYTRSVLDALPDRDQFADELAKLLSLDAWGIPRMAGDRLFYSLRRGDQAQPVLYVQPLPADAELAEAAEDAELAEAAEGAKVAEEAEAADDAEAEVLLDVNAL